MESVNRQEVAWDQPCIQYKIMEKVYMLIVMKALEGEYVVQVKDHTAS